MINKLLLDQGLAEVITVPPNVKYSDWLSNDTTSQSDPSIPIIPFNNPY